MHEAVDAFLLTKQIAGCTSATMSTYRWWLQHFTSAVGDVTPINVRQFFVGFQHRSASHQHRAFRTLRTADDMAATLHQLGAYSPPWLRNSPTK